MFAAEDFEVSRRQKTNCCCFLGVKAEARKGKGEDPKKRYENSYVQSRNLFFIIPFR